MDERSLLIVDDHELFRGGVAALIQSEQLPFVVTEASSYTEAVALLDKAAPDIAIVDYELPEKTGLDLVRHIRTLGLRTRIVMLTGTASSHVAHQALQEGAYAVIAKRGAGDELLEALTADATPYISEAFSLSEGLARMLDTLTPREREALGLLVEGLSTKELANAMGVSFKTAETHRSHLMAKLDVHSIGELLKRANELGIARRG